MEPQVLINKWPWMDWTMAETLIKAHEKGTLQEMAESWPDKEEDVKKDVKDDQNNNNECV